MSEDSKKCQLDEIQMLLIERISKNDTNGFKQLLGQLKGGVNFVDDSGMSILAHASFKGNKEVVQLLLDMVSEQCNLKRKLTYAFLHREQTLI